MAEGSGRKAKDKKSYYLSRRGRGREKIEDPCRIFVANISFKISEDELAEFFSAEFGPVVSAEILKDHKRKLSRGIGFVTFSSAELAQQVLAAPPEKLILDGRDLRVDVAVSKRQWSRAQGSKITAVECDEGDGRAGDRESSVAVNQQDSLLLNDDILFRVFSYLSLKERVRAERVCRQWRAVARRWWKSLKTLSFEGVFVTFKCALTDSIFSSILHRGCHKLTSLDVSASPTQLTEHSLQLIGRCCEELTSLNISRVHTTPQSLKTLTQHCTKLKTLIVRGCHSVGEKSLWWTLRHCQQLQELDVSQNKRLNGQCFFMAPPTLLSVSLRECDQLTDVGVTLLAQRTPNLQCLDISQCSRLGGESLRSLSKHCLSLQELHFCGPNQRVGNEDFQAVASIPGLEHLVVDQQMSFDDTVLNQISVVRKLRRLSCAACYAVSDHGVTNLSCVPLTRLNLSYCHLVSDIGVSGLAKTGTLQKLVVRACPNLTDKGLIDVSKCCTELTELDVSGCWQLTDSVLYALQESLLHMRVHQNLHFSLTVGGTSISGESALKFARITGSSVCLDDLSTDSLNPWLDYNSTVESMPADEEDWDPVGTPSATAVDSKPEPADEEDWDPVGTPSANVAKPVTPAEDEDGEVQFVNYSMERAYDWLEADDPALFSDEFSDPEEWGMM